MEGIACSWMGASYTSKAAKITATLTQAMTPSYCFLSPLDSPVECKHNSNASVALCKRYKQIMSLSLEIKCKPYLEKRGRLYFKGQTYKSHFFDAGCQLLRALGGSIAMWGASNFVHKRLKLAILVLKNSRKFAIYQSQRIRTTDVQMWGREKKNKKC